MELTVLMTNYATGHLAEQHAAVYLEGEGYSIIEINWKTPRCEIDVICQKHETIYFVEVKYRKSDQQGTGLDYITPRKLQRMTYAAESWVHFNSWSGEYALAAVEMTGLDYQVTGLVTDI